MMNINVKSIDEKANFEIVSKKPLQNRIITTARKYNNNSIIEKIDTIDNIQVVIAVGPVCREVKVGDIVEIDPSRYVRQAPARAWDGAIDLKKPMPTVDIPMTIMNGEKYLEITENDVKSIITEYKGKIVFDE